MSFQDNLFLFIEYTFIMFIDFSKIAIFLLGTTIKNTKHPQQDPTYYQSRILPIHETWGALYPHLYFVFGNNYFDIQFLDQKCQSEEISLQSLEHGHKVYRCQSYHDLTYKQFKTFEDVQSSSSSPDTSTLPSYSLNAHETLNQYHQEKQRGIHVLYTSQCKGSYFGIGPTCRCQEAMRYYYTEQSIFAQTEWFLFMDDDVYLRPFGLQYFLYLLQQSYSMQRPMAMVSAANTFTVKSVKYDESIIQKCNNFFETSLFLAQPALINRQAMNILQQGIMNQSMSKLHSYWGGSHDLILGLLLWIHEIPLYSLEKSYLGHMLYIHKKLHHSLSKQYLFYHRIMNIRTNTPKQHSIVSQFHLSEKLSDSLLYNQPYTNHDNNYKNSQTNFTTTSSSSATTSSVAITSTNPVISTIITRLAWNELIQQQLIPAKYCFDHLLTLNASTLSLLVASKPKQTLFPSKEEFRMITPLDC